MTNVAVVTAGKISFSLDFAGLFETREEENELAEVIRNVPGVETYTSSLDVRSHVVHVPDGYDARNVRIGVMLAIRNFYLRKYPDRSLVLVDP